MRNAMWVGGGITGMGEIPILGVKEKGIAKVIRDIFRNGEKGFFYDPSDLKAEYRDSAGTASVNATGEPLGLVLDKSKGLVLGPEKIVNGDFSNGSTNWAVLNSDATHVITFANEKVRFQSDTTTPVLSISQANVYEIDKWYEVTVVCSSYVSGALKMDVGNGGVVIAAGLGTFKTKILARTTTLNLVRNTANVDITIDSISVKEIAGNHAYQTTSAARPILQDTPILGAEVVADVSFKDPSYWNLTGTGWTIANNVASAVNATGGVNRAGILKPNTTYECIVKVNRVSGSFNLPYDGLGVNIQARYVSGTFKRILTTSSSATFLAIYGNNFTGTVEFVSAKEITGYRTDQNYLAFDGIDDKLITNLPATLTNATVLRSVPGVGTQVKYLQTLPMMYEDSTNHSGLVAIDRALTRQEQLRLMTELDKKAGATSLETLTFKTFDNNQEGFVFDPNDLSTLFQDAAGTVPVTGAGQPVGLVLDKRKGAALGLELSNYSAGFSSLAGISPVGATLSLEGNALVITAQVGTSRRAEIPISGLTVGKFYKIKFIARKNEIGIQQNFQQFTAFNKFHYQSVVTSTTASEYTFILEATSVSGVLRAYASSAEAIGAQMIIESVSVKEVSGNHAYQTTSASRPILRRNAGTGANYLEFDGTDDSLQTGNINFTATDKVSLFVGVRKLSDVYSALCVELGDGTSSTLNAFALFAPSSNGTARYDLRNVVSALGANTQDMKFNAPNSAVLSGTVTPNKVDKTSLSVNGEAALTTKTGRSGNLTSAPLYIGRRGGTSLPFTGHIYGLIGIGKLVSASETAAIEKELAKRVGVTLNV